MSAGAAFLVTGHLGNLEPTPGDGPPDRLAQHPSSRSPLVQVHPILVQVGPHARLRRQRRRASRAGGGTQAAKVGSPACGQGREMQQRGSAGALGTGEVSRLADGCRRRARGRERGTTAIARDRALLSTRPALAGKGEARFQ